MARRKFKAGQVVWAKVPDRSGVIKDEPRPILVILTHPTDKRGPLVGLAISTDPSVDSTDPAIEMPWDAQTGSTTGLYRWCRVVLLWSVIVPQEQIADVSGSVSAEFLESVEKAMRDAELWSLRGKRRS